ncbi:MAG: demethoxyubiquinone hydroxylase family protein [Albidovulum sp.]|uniref:demethoxyubiquinone hydroxylase family protein n=1 Tax=Albidovulum sp. TaxID=1872424 RepID=UPI003C9F06CA
MTVTPPHIAIARIVRVNHAGEYGAIRIYGAQILVSRWLWRGIVAPLNTLRSHEIEHCRLFKAAMPARGSRPCRTMWLWSMGGWLLGFFCAALGPRAIWVCTEAVEKNVHRHLADQLSYLRGHDAELHDLIDSIREEEEGHVALALENRGDESALTRLLAKSIDIAVNSVIWLSTWGDSARMRRDLGGLA